MFPQKSDPYATPTQRRVNALLVGLSVIAVAVLFATSPRAGKSWRRMAKARNDMKTDSTGTTL
jgi:hypothetical protein